MSKQILKPPFFTSSRLLPAVKIGDVTVSLKMVPLRDEYGQPKWEYHLDGHDVSHFKSDFHGWGGTQEMMSALLAFLGVAGEGDKTDLIPESVSEWAAEHQDEIAMLRRKLEETEDLVEEWE